MTQNKTYNFSSKICINEKSLFFPSQKYKNSHSFIVSYKKLVRWFQSESQIRVKKSNHTSRPENKAVSALGNFTVFLVIPTHLVCSHNTSL